AAPSTRFTCCCACCRKGAAPKGAETPWPAIPTPHSPARYTGLPIPPAPTPPHGERCAISAILATQGGHRPCYAGFPGHHLRATQTQIILVRFREYEGGLNRMQDHSSARSGSAAHR